MLNDLLAVFVRKSEPDVSPPLAFRCFISEEPIIPRHFRLFVAPACPKCAKLLVEDFVTWLRHFHSVLFAKVLGVVPRDSLWWQYFVLFRSVVYCSLMVVDVSHGANEF